MTYTPPTISGYNDTPPPDDGSQVTANKVLWSTIKTKLADPIKNYVDSINVAVQDAFLDQFLSDVTDKATNFTIGTTDDGKLFNCTSALTATFPPAADAGEGFKFCLFNNVSSGNVIGDGNSGELINGSATHTSNRQYEATIYVCTGSAWLAIKVTQAVNLTSSTLASATTTDLGTATTNNVVISGTTTITGFGSSASLVNPIYFIRFSGALLLTHNGTSLIIPGSRNITTVAGDSGIVEYLGSGNWRVLSFSTVTSKKPSFQYLTTGTAATYTTPANCVAILVQMVGAGGGGGAFSANAGAAGGDTIFNSVNAKGGSGGAIGNVAGSIGGAGGTGGTGTASLRIPGGCGVAQYGLASAGVPSLMGGAPGGGNTTSAGQNAAANTGAGGGGAAANGAAQYGASPGGSGEYVEIYITNPSATYTYTIGAAGTGGAAGTLKGGDGGSGFIIVTEYY